MMRMMSLTTAQRDLLHQLLAADAPMSAAALGQQLHLTPRQIQYGLREIRTWLSYHQATLRHSPGVGAQVICTPTQRQSMLAELASQPHFQLILTSEQRQQLLALQLLAADKPFILSQFQDAFAVARATVLKDLDALVSWLQRFGLTVGRRQHRGFWIEGPELAKRQALAALLWGDLPVERPIMWVEGAQRIVFGLGADAALLAAVAQASDLVAAWDLPAAQQRVAWAEAELGGRFTDEALTQLALALAIQIQRVAGGYLVAWAAEELRWIKAQPSWPVAARLASQLFPDLSALAQTAEAATLTVLLLAHERDEPWRCDLGAQAASYALSDELLVQIARTLAMPELVHDQLLRDGLEAHLLPACVRERFGIWRPTRAVVDAQTEGAMLDRAVTAQLAAAASAAMGMALPPDALNNLVLLLHAAMVRARPTLARRVLVVCPSGMATTQLLIARLRARFPHLGTLEVLPIRALSPERIADADLIITTVPLTLPANLSIDIIQVHPMLKAEDSLALTHWIFHDGR